MGGRNPADGTPYTATACQTWQFHYDEFGNLMTTRIRLDTA